MSSWSSRGSTSGGPTNQEHLSTWPGDEPVAEPSFVWTNAITIKAPAADIWPWLVQLGQGRGGLYSHDWLENLIGCEMHSADRILPAFQTPLQLPEGRFVIENCWPSPTTASHVGWSSKARWPAGGWPGSECSAMRCVAGATGSSPMSRRRWPVPSP